MSHERIATQTSDVCDHSNYHAMSSKVTVTRSIYRQHAYIHNMLCYVTASSSRMKGRKTLKFSVTVPRNSRNHFDVNRSKVKVTRLHKTQAPNVP